MTGAGRCAAPDGRACCACSGASASRSSCCSSRPLALAAPPHRCGTEPAGPVAALGAADRSVAVAAWTAARPARGRRRCRREEQADRLVTDFEVDTDGSVVVTETITWRFPEGEERHGILRNVKVRAGYQDSETQYRYYELTGVSVTSPSGAPTDISISDFGAYRQIRVGSPSQTVSRHRRLRRAVPARARRQRHRRRHRGVLLQRRRPLQRLPPAAGLGHRRPARSPATRAACFYGELGSTDPVRGAWPATTRTFTVPDLEAEQGASVLTSYPRDAFGDLTPDLREGSADADSGGVVSPGLARAPRLAHDRPRRPPAAARRGPDGAARVEPRARRAVRRPHPGPDPGRRPAGAGRRGRARAPRWRCSSPRRRACSPAWSARSSTRRSTSSTSPPRSSTSPCAVTCRSPATTRASSAPTTGCSPAPRRRPPRRALAALRAAAPRLGLRRAATASRSRS